MKKRFYFVRHGATDWNVLHKFQGHTDISLNETGLEQAGKIALRLEKSKATRVISSPLLRARQTAEAIAGSSRSLEIWPELVEQCYGDWEGKSRSEVKAKSGELFAAWKAGKANVPGGETEEEIFSRAKLLCERLSASGDEENIVAGHGGIFRMLFLAMLGSDYSPIFWQLKLDNCALSLAELDESGRWTMCYIGDCLHTKINSREPEQIRMLPLD